MKRCTWCGYAGIPKKENSHDESEVGAIDSEGDWICDDCFKCAVEGALEDAREEK